MALKEFDASSGQALQESKPAAIAPAFEVAAHARIQPSPTNPRTSASLVRLRETAANSKTRKRVLELTTAAITPQSHAELVEILGTERLVEFVLSIASHDVNTPALVRPMPPALRKGELRAVDFELVAGERRYWGSLLTGKPGLPVMIKSMADGEVLEFQLIENLQRDDLHELEEAEGYERLCQATGIRKEDVAGKIGRSRSYVYQRIKLLDLCKEAREAFRSATIDFSRAIIIARIPDHKLQLRALEESQKHWYGEDGDQVMSVRDFSSWVQREIMLGLGDAPFDTKDEALVKKAGSCSACPKRTGANPELFSDVNSADLCTDPKCFAGKKEAHFAAVGKAAEAAGQKVIFAADAEKIFKNGATVPSGYTRVDKPAYLDGIGYKSLEQAVGKKNLPEPVLVQNPHTKELEPMLPNATVNKLVKEVQAQQPATASGRSGRVTPVREKSFDELWQEQAVREIFAQLLAGKCTHMSTEIGRMIIRDNLNRFYEYDLLAELLLIDGKVGASKAVDEFAENCPPAMIGPLLLVTLALADIDEEGGPKPPVLMQLLQETGVDVDAIKLRVKATMPEEGKGGKKGAGGKKAAPRGANAAFMAPMQPSDQLGVIVGHQAIPRVEIVSRLWAYIKKHKLQDEKNKRMVKCDAPLQSIFDGRAEISMFEMANAIAKHLKPAAATAGAAQAGAESEENLPGQGKVRGGKKLSAAAAKQGIANAMQNVDEEPGGE
jgi:ParB/RepB/Spo0J family partition protein